MIRYVFIVLILSINHINGLPQSSSKWAALVNLPVLCYHNISPALAKHNPAYTIDTCLFRQQMQMLSDSGYTTVLPRDIPASGYGPATRRSKFVTLTFDDGHASHFTVVLPILQEFKFKGVFFVPTSVIDKKGYLTTEQIRQLSDMGHEIAAHTHDHPDMRHMDSTAFKRQVEWPKHTLEHITNKPVNSFAYPFGAWNQAVIKQLIDCGFKSAFILGGKRSASHKEFTIRRLMVGGDWPPQKLFKSIQ